MNSVSWFLYAIDVIGNVRGLCLGILAATGLCWLGLNISVLASEGEVLEWPDFKKWWIRGALMMMATAFVIAVFPSRNTMYAIAASQVGEQVIKNEAVQGLATDAAKALHEWIKKQIDDKK